MRSRWLQGTRRRRPLAWRVTIGVPPAYRRGGDVPRDLPIGNDRLLVLFDEDYVLRDLYYPNVGKENHAGGYPFRFGVWVDGQFAWMGRPSGWQIDRRYEPDTLLTSVSARHNGLGLQLDCTDAVDFHETVLLRKVV